MNTDTKAMYFSTIQNRNYFPNEQLRKLTKSSIPDSQHQTSASFMQQQQSSFSSSSSTQQQSQVKSILKQPKQLTQQQTHGEEIQQESLKTTIQSAITDIGNAKPFLS